MADSRESTSVAYLADIVKACITEASEKQQRSSERTENALRLLAAKVETLELKTNGLAASISNGGTSRSTKMIRIDDLSSATSARKVGADSELDPVRLGDLLVLSSTSIAGYLSGDLASERIGVQRIEKNDGRDPLNFEDHVYRVCPMLSYRQKNEYRAVSAALATTSISGGDAVNGRSETAFLLAAAERKVLNEERQNAETLARLAVGSHKSSVVKYGDSIMLQHVKSGAFISVLDKAAPLDPECRAVHLLAPEKGSGGALLQFMPQFKAQTKGSVVYYGHHLIVESFKQRGMHLHVSQKMTWSQLPSVQNPDLPKCLQTGQTFEANLSPKAEAFVVARYARFTAADHAHLRTSSPFRLYHPQTEALVNASCDPDKDRIYPEGRVGGVPAHIPYLRKLADRGETPDPNDRTHHFPKSVWCFEPLTRRYSRTVAWRQPVRLRHLASGRYLAVDTSLAIPIIHVTGDAPSLDDEEMWYRTYMVDDAQVEEDPDFFNIFGKAYSTDFKTAKLESLVFWLSSAVEPNSSCLPMDEMGLRIEHEFLDPTTQERRRLYLHGTGARKPRRADQPRPGKCDSALCLPGADDIFSLLRRFHSSVILLATSYRHWKTRECSRPLLGD